MNLGARHRLLLSLRSEKAMGLRSISKSSLDVVDSSESESDTPMKHASDAAAPVQQAQDRPALFESPVVKKQMSLPVAEAFNSPALTTEEKRERLAAMQEKEVQCCTKCRLHETRMQTVFGEGDVDAKIMFVGEGPGENEDLTGRPFVGRAGQLLDKMIVAMGLRREQVFIANIVKCRPPENRVPALDEVATCTPYLERQIEIIRPRVIVTLGRPAASYMLGNPKLTMGSVRGQWNKWRDIKLMPTFHPSYVLRTYTEEVRKAVWTDLKKVMEEVSK